MVPGRTGSWRESVALWHRRGPFPGQLYRYKDFGFVTLVKLRFAFRGNGQSAISIQALRFLRL
ncbi:hypothetical protein EAE96_004372 [Botrytis aclada]|nr:hypothetical protein EAE96_004372 [Botrytis aclada]